MEERFALERKRQKPIAKPAATWHSSSCHSRCPDFQEKNLVLYFCLLKNGKTRKFILSECIFCVRLCTRTLNTYWII